MDKEAIDGIVSSRGEADRDEDDGGEREGPVPEGPKSSKPSWDEIEAAITDPLADPYERPGDEPDRQPPELGPIVLEPRPEDSDSEDDDRDATRELIDRVTEDLHDAAPPGMRVDIEDHHGGLSEPAAERDARHRDVAMDAAERAVRASERGESESARTAREVTEDLEAAAGMPGAQEREQLEEITSRILEESASTDSYGSDDAEESQAPTPAEITERLLEEAPD